MVLTGFRYILKNKVSTIINSLVIALSVCYSLMVSIVIKNELGVDSDLRDCERIMFLESKWVEGNQSFQFMTLSPISKTLAEEYPQLVESYFRFWERKLIVSFNEKHFTEQVMLVDSTLTGMFGFQFLRGNPKMIFQDPSSIIVTKKVAEKYFDSVDVIGRVLNVTTEINGVRPFTIVGVLQDLPANSVTGFMNMDAQIMIPISASSNFSLPSVEIWHSGSIIMSYVKTVKGTSVASLDRALAQILARNLPKDLNGRLLSVHPTPLRTYHLNANSGQKRDLVILLVLLSIMLIVTASFNFINISITSVFMRAKEIGVRKLLGSSRGDLALRLFLESFLICSIAAVIGLVLYNLSHDLLSRFLNIHLPTVSSFDSSTWVILAIMIIVLSIGSGVFPSLLISSLSIVSTLRGRTISIDYKGVVPLILLTIQFGLTIGLFQSALIMNKQLDHLSSKDLGYRKTSVLTVSSVPRFWSSEGLQKISAACNEFRRIPEIEDVSISWEVPSGNFGGTVDIYKANQSKESSVSAAMLVADEHFDDVFQLKMTEGSFLKENPNLEPTNLVVLNEVAANSIKVRVGDRIKFTTLPFELIVSGITMNHNFTTLREHIKPMVVLSPTITQSFRYLSFKFQEGKGPTALAKLRLAWTKMFPDAPFEYEFLEDKLDHLYDAETILDKALRVATILFVVNIALSVFCLIYMSINRRKREISMRMMLGASLGSLTRLFLMRFLILIVVSFCFVSPVFYFYAQNWLSSFAFRTEFSIDVFLMPIIGIVLLVISVLVCYLAFTRSKIRIVKTMQHE